MKTWKRKLYFALHLAVVLALVLVPVVHASEVDVTSVVDVTAPVGSVSLQPGQSGAITINMQVIGKQGVTAYFDVYTIWILKNGVFTGSNPVTFTVNPREAQDAPTVFQTPGQVIVDSSQAVGLTRTFTVSAINIVNGIGQGKLGDGTDANYSVTVVAPPDSTPPVITPNVSGTLGSNGWYTSNVTVSWSVVDNESAISSSSGCGSTTINSDTTSTTLTCSATSGGGTSSQSVTIKRDATKPTNVVVSADRDPDSNGWYNHPFTATWSGQDALSGVASCTSTPYSGPDTGTGSLTGTCTDNAGNASAPVSFDFKFDATAPTAYLEVTAGTKGSNDWYTSDVTVETKGKGSVSGFTCTAPQIISAETAGNEVNGSCTTGAGLTVNAAPITIKLDKTAPTASLAVTAGNPGANGWYTSDVTLTTTGEDGISGVTCTNPQYQTNETAGTDFFGVCTNGAGLFTTSNTISIKLDKTAPSAELKVTAGNEGTNGWYTSDVTISTSGSDNISGPVSCTANQYQTSETKGQEFKGSCTNDAGLKTDADPLTVKLDKSGPTNVVLTASGDKGENDWFVGDVTIFASGVDSISEPVICTEDQFLKADSTGTIFAGSCTNGAGLSTNAESLTVKRDATAPEISVALDRNYTGTGWFNVSTGAPVAEFTCHDATSGIVSCPADFTFGEGKDLSHTGTAEDAAGNTADASVSGVYVDLTAPTISASLSPATPSSGWYNIASGAPTVSFTCSDSLSGIPVSTCPASHTFGEGENQSYSNSVSDAAGNSASAGVENVDVDLTNPSLTWNSLINNGDSFYFGEVPAAPTCTASDLLSGANGCNVAGYGTGVGSHTLTATAHDVAGNFYQEFRTFNVLSWTLKGFYQPVDMSGATIVWNTVKGGSTVPLKFEVFAGSVEKTDVAVIDTYYAQKVTCVSGVEDGIETLSPTGGTSLRYDFTAGQFIYNWQTPKAAGTCYKAVVTTDDGSSIYAYFKLK